MHETLDIFEGEKKQTKDYHGMLDSAYFIAWMRKLLDALDVRGVSKAITGLDNAKYHNLIPHGTSQRRWPNADISQNAPDYGV